MSSITGNTVDNFNIRSNIDLKSSSVTFSISKGIEIVIGSIRINSKIIFSLFNSPPRVVIISDKISFAKFKPSLLSVITPNDFINSSCCFC